MRYKYLVSYFFRCDDGTLGAGWTTIETQEKLDTDDRLKEIEAQVGGSVRTQVSLSAVSLLCSKKAK